ncbi:GNAT family N-acetyltransferase, cg3035/Rv0428c family, partial [Nocardia farcinica]|uniref:GNAT family N-acetyltransferase, cg3035/Rv0428c family n=1 Tax=Nocardia farcinica TaxID=37329 RepID=UPI003F69C59F
PKGAARSRAARQRTPRLGVDVLHRIGEWYTARGLPPRLVLPDRLAPPPPGWQTWGETLVLCIVIENFVLPQGP